MQSTQRQVTFIDLFAGIGGFRMALTSVGCKCVFSSEIDRFAAITYAANFDDYPRGDIRLIDADDIPDHDILCAGFPCQPFSIAARNTPTPLGFDHQYGNLFFDIIRVLLVKRPAVVFLENVDNLREHDYGRTFDVIKAQLEALGYDLHIKIIDAQRVLPQRRKRIFIVGFLKPTDFHWPVFKRRTLQLRDLLLTKYPSRYVLTDNLWHYYRDFRSGPGTFPYNLIDPATNPVVPTLHAGYGKDCKRILIQRSKGNPRKITPREAARLQGYPDSFVIPVSDTQAYRQFGNSVAVPIVTAIGRQIVDALQA